MKKLVIDRSRWGRGKNGGYLLDGQDRMCCLGFHAKACGFGDVQLRHHCEPTDLGRERPEYEDDAWLFEVPEAHFVYGLSARKPSPAMQILININDAEDVDEPTREAWLTEGFRVLGGIEVEFVDGPVQP